MKNVLSFLLIAGFFLVLSPRTVFHAHEHDLHEEEIKKEKGETIFENHCYACDVNLSLYTPSSPTAYFLPKKQYALVKTTPTKAGEKNFSHVLSLRGPPFFI